MPAAKGAKSKAKAAPAAEEKQKEAPAATKRTTRSGNAGAAAAPAPKKAKAAKKAAKKEEEEEKEEEPEAEAAEVQPKSVFGDWAKKAKSLAALHKAYTGAQPFDHVVIPNFFSGPVAAALAEKFPVPHGAGAAEWRAEGWHVYDNPIEGKLAMDKVEAMPAPEFPDAFAYLQSPEAVGIFSKISGIKDLVKDPHLHGAGCHLSPEGGKLDMHLDYSIHPISNLERRLNLIVYLTRPGEWKDEYGGHVELWEAGMAKLGKKYSPTFNTGVLFRTYDESWHGLPEPITCPPGMANGRRSLAIYYLSPPRTGATMREKARFVARPQDPKDPGLDKLREIRVHRRLTEEDLKEHAPWFKPRWAS